MKMDCLQPMNFNELPHTDSGIFGILSGLLSFPSNVLRLDQIGFMTAVSLMALSADIHVIVVFPHDSLS